MTLSWLQDRIPVAHFVNALASDSPVISYLPISVAEILTGAFRREGAVLNASEVDVMQEQYPLLYHLLVVLACGSPVAAVPASCVQLLETPN